MAASLASVALLARLFTSQAPDATPEPAAEAPAAAPAPEPTAPDREPSDPPARERVAPEHPRAERLQPQAQQPPAVEDVREGSLAIVRALMARDLDTLARLTPTPFSFDGADAVNRAAVRQRWAALLERYPVDQLQLRGVVVLSYEELVARHGKPPVRLQRLSLPGTQAAVVDLNGKDAVLLWRKRAKGFQLFAISD